MKDTKVAFVVLHYCQVDVTMNCIDSLLNLKGDPQIVVVDNASPDGSGIQLKEKFKANKKVYVVLNDANLGFATANNVGYRYAKDELGAEVIAVINNDTIIEDTLFIEKLLASDFLSKYHIIAPDIINMEGLHQNPKAMHVPNYKKIVNTYRKAKVARLIYSIPVIGDIKAMMATPPKFNTSKQKGVCEMIVPHGAAVIYTPLWIKKEDIAFCPGTFMYVEETLLSYYIIKHHYKTLYCPDFKIIHLEDVSTKSRFKNKRKRSLFQLKHSIKSHQVLINYIEENGLKYV